MRRYGVPALFLAAGIIFASPELGLSGDFDSTSGDSHPFSHFGSSTGGDAVKNVFSGGSPFSDFGRASGGDAVRNVFSGGSPFRDFGNAAGGDPVKNLLEDLGPFSQFGNHSPPTPDDGPPAADGNDAPPPDEMNSASSSNAAADEDRDRKSSAPIPWADAGKVGREDAEENFPNVVETYLAKHRSHGHWPYTSGAKTRALDLVEVDTSHMRSDGPYYAACAIFREVGGPRRVRLEFTADFTDVAWRIVSVKPRSRKGPCAD